MLEVQFNFNGRAILTLGTLSDVVTRGRQTKDTKKPMKQTVFK